ncbi:MAG: rhomboid family intramembrane serine protease [Anaerolineae bacterium]|nr:rhomboid family intramembrane serine protease [Anaerolineae bacterium]
MSDKLQQGRTAARVGDTAEARRLFNEAAQEDPNNAAAWLELAGVVEDLAEKKTYLDRVVDLEPDNASAKATLALLEKKTADGGPIRQAQGRPPTVVDLAQDFGSTEEADPLYCYQHPKVETSLRCNRCNRPICAKCAQRTPVGFRCSECILAIEDRYYSQVQGDYLNPYDHPPAKPLFTYILMGAIGLVWLAQEVAGGSEEGQVLVKFGANYGPLILQGQVWRLFTSMFLHIGAQHLIFNVIGLIAFGFEMERLYGRARFIAVYLLAGLFGSLASFALRGPMTYSAGASGAIFGVVGMQLAFFLFYRRRLGEFGRRQRNTALILIGVSLLMGCSGLMPADNYAHLGGFLAGVVLGYPLVPRYRIDYTNSRRRIQDRASLLRRWWMPALGLAALVSGVWLAISFWAAGGWWGMPLPGQPGGGTIAYGQTVEGRLVGEEGDLWQFEGEAGQVVTITMRSDEIDAQVGLFDPDNEYLTEDGDSGDDDNARIDAYVLPVTGTYTIYAISSDGQPGAYYLTLKLDNSFNQTS